MKDKQLLEKVYVTPKNFAECIDTVFSNNVDKIAHYFGVKSDRDNISVDMLMEWLSEKGSDYAEFIGFTNSCHKSSFDFNKEHVPEEGRMSLLDRIANYFKEWDGIEKTAPKMELSIHDLRYIADMNVERCRLIRQVEEANFNLKNMKLLLEISADEIENLYGKKTYGKKTEEELRYSPTCKELKSMRELTGLGVGKCKELLVRFNGDLDECIRTLRANSDEPWHEGLTEGRIDILKDGIVIFTCRTLSQVWEAGFQGRDFQTGRYNIRSVDCFGRYEMIGLK